MVRKQKLGVIAFVVLVLGVSACDHSPTMPSPPVPPVPTEDTIELISGKPLPGETAFLGTAATFTVSYTTREPETWLFVFALTGPDPKMAIAGSSQSVNLSRQGEAITTLKTSLGPGSVPVKTTYVAFRMKNKSDSDYRSTFMFPYEINWVSSSNP